MINSIKQAIVNKLSVEYSGYKIYDEDVPQNFKKSSFLITVTDQDYNKKLNNKYSSLLSFDIAYFSSKSITEIKADLLETQQNLLRKFDIIDTFRVLNKQANITDNVLHFTFDISFSELKTDISEPMQSQTINIKL